jgi:hypothetical protein
VGVSEVGGKFVHKSLGSRFEEKSTSDIRENAMKEVNPEREAQARELAAAIAESSEQELLQIALTLLEAEEPASLFGDTEFKIRDLALKIAAKAYEQRLAQKKTATEPPV